jgi:hypothetical protein
MRARHNTLVSVVLAFLLPVALLPAGAKPKPILSKTTKQPQKRERFMKAGLVEHEAGKAIVTANHPRSLDQAISVVREEYGWVVDYEDPPYMSDTELVDDTDPQWRASHLKARGVRRVAGGPFRCEFEEDSTITSSEGEETVLKKIVSEYNKSGNPGKFTVRSEDEGRYSIVGTSVKNQAGDDQQVVPILDTIVSVPVDLRDAENTIKVILKDLSDKTGIRTGLVGFGNNALSQSQVTVGGEGLPARTLLLQTLKATNRSFVWALLYDADNTTYFLNVAIATRSIHDTNGRKTSLPIDFGAHPRTN